MNLDCPHSNYWSVVRLKDVLSSVSNKTCDTQLPYIALEHIEGFSGKLLSHCVDVYEKEIEGTYNEFQVGDVLFGKLRPYLAKCWLAIFSGKCSLEFLVLRSKNINNIFLKYLLLSPSYLHIINSSTYGTKMPRANWTFIGNMKIFLPPFEEQKAIAEYLDREVSRMDRIVELLTAQQERYDQLKRSLISEVISKGLPHHNGTIDNEEISYKDCFIPWLKVFPEGWSVSRIKETLDESFSGAWGDEAIGDNSYVCVRVADFDSDTGRVDFRGEPTYRAYTSKELENKSLRDKDILLEKSGGGEKVLVGRAVLWDRAHEYNLCMCANFLQVLRVKENKILPEYLLLVMGTIHNTKAVRHFIKQTTGIQNLSLGAYLSQSIPLPPLEEQSEIVEYLDERCGRIDRISELIGRKIELMESLKKSLIEEVVTGQRCVEN